VLPCGHCRQSHAAGVATQEESHWQWRQWVGVAEASSEKPVPDIP
jgi:hypothetical protein